MMAPHRNQWVGGGGGQNIAPTVYDKRAQTDFSLPRVMAIFWASDVAIQFGRGRDRFFRPADKDDIAKLILALIPRLASEPYPSFARGVASQFGKTVRAAHRCHIITFQWWWVRMLRELATIPNMLDATNRYPGKDLFENGTTQGEICRNLRAAGFGERAKRQMNHAQRYAKPVTLPVPPANTQEEEDAA